MTSGWLVGAHSDAEEEAQVLDFDMVTPACGGESRTGAFVDISGKPYVANGWTAFMILADSSLPGRYTVSIGQVKVIITLEHAME